MNPITRRALLRTTAFTAPAFALAACAGAGGGVPVTVNVPVSSWTNAIQGIGQYFTQQFLPSLTSAGAKIPASTLGTIERIVGGIGGAAAGVNAATTQSQGAGVLATIENYANELAPVVAPFLALIPGAGPILTIALAAMPAVEGLVNMGSTLLSPLAQQIATQPVASTPTTAAAVLSPSAALQIVLQRTGRG